jgi:hypothetical protein
LIPGVSLRLTNLKTDAVLKTLSDESGKFKFDAPPGTYELRADLSGFEPSIVPDVQIKESESQTFHLILSIGKSRGRYIPIAR